MRLISSIFLFLFLFFLAACNFHDENSPQSLRIPVGIIKDPKLTESSGLVASGNFEDIYWTHNDDGEPLLFAIRSSGEVIRSYLLEGFINHDWEDIAADGERLYLYDNISRIEKSNRGNILILHEPNPFEEASAVVESLVEFQYPISGEDIETLIVHRGKAYFVSKPWDNSFPRIYVLDELQSGTYARRIGELPELAMITGGDISDDGKRIALSSYRALIIFEGQEDPEGIFLNQPIVCQLNAGQVEGITWRDNSLLVSTEQGNIYLIPRANWSKRQAPFQSCPVIDIPYLYPLPDIRTPLKTWERGSWLNSQTVLSDKPICRIVWNEEGLHLGMELDPSVELAELGKFDTTEFDTWFESGRIYLLINPSGTRPMSFGPDDRCIVIGLDSDGEIDALALQLKPATYVQELEQSPPWVSFKKIDHRIMITISSSGPGLSQIQEKRQYGFNIMITGQTGALNSWAPLTTAFPWDAPSIWGLINLEK